MWILSIKSSDSRSILKGLTVPLPSLLLNLNLTLSNIRTSKRTQAGQSFKHHNDSAVVNSPSYPNAKAQKQTTAAGFEPAPPERIGIESCDIQADRLRPLGQTVLWFEFCVRRSLERNAEHFNRQGSRFRPTHKILRVQEMNTTCYS